MPVSIGLKLGNSAIVSDVFDPTKFGRNGINLNQLFYHIINLWQVLNRLAL